MSAATIRRRRVLAITAAALALASVFVFPATALATGTVHEGGDAVDYGDTGTTGVVGGVAAVVRTASGDGYWIVTGGAGVTAHGDAVHHGDLSSATRPAPVVDAARTPSGNGYWLVEANGSVLTFGDASYHGSVAGLSLAAPVVAIVPTKFGGGYWMLLANGGVFTFGNASFHGSPSPATLAGATAVGMERSAAGLGYWIALSDGRLLPFGDAPALGSATLPSAAVDFAATPSGTGGFVVDVDGHVDAVGTATVETDVEPVDDVVAIESTASGAGYWVASTGPMPGIIEGVVTDENGDPIANACVNHTAVSGTGGRTTSTGYYRLAPQFVGTGALLFSDCARDEYLAEYWDDASVQSEATLITTSIGDDTTANATLAPASSISGVVTDENGDPLSGVCVSATDPDVPPFALGNNGHGQTSSTGYYRASGLAPGSYSVQFADCTPAGRYLSEYYDDVDFRSLQTMVPLDEGEDVGDIDADLSPAAQLTGVVTKEGGGPATFACVEVRRDGNFAGSVFTSSTGYYSVGRLRTGTYTALYRPCGAGSTYAYEWLGDAATEDASTPLSLVEGTESTADVTLDVGGSILGTVYRESNNAVVPNTCVWANNEGSDIRSFAQTSSTGYYRINGVREGDVNVRFEQCVFPPVANPLAPEWYDDAANEASATPVPVQHGQMTQGINAFLADGGAITGVVSDGGSPVHFACVSAYDGDEREVGRAITSSTGYYRIAGLPETTRVFFGCNDNGFVHEWWDDEQSFDAATPVVVAAGGTVPGIDADLDEPASIEGTVLDENGDPIEGVCARPEPWSRFEPRRTSSTGYYVIDRLHAGSYAVEFQDCGTGYDSEWWDDAADEAGATPVGVLEGQRTLGIDAVLRFGIPGPASVGATAGDGSALVTWTAPSPAPVREVLGYEVRAHPDGPRVVTSALATEASLVGLTNGTEYTAVVRAIYRDGRGVGASSAPFVPEGEPEPVSSCVKDGGEVLVTMLAGDDVTLGRTAGGAFAVTGTASAADCGGASVDNVDSVRVVVGGGGGGASAESLTVDLSNGLFAPGLTPEGSDASEIEITVDLGGGADLVRVVGSSGDDVVRGIGRRFAFLAGSEHDALFVESDLARFEIAGGAGDDTVDTMLADPVIVDGDGGNDTLSARGLGGIVRGGDDDDSVGGSAGSDSLDGGSGLDVVDYGWSPHGVSVDLGAGVGAAMPGSGSAESDSLAGFESVEGSNFGDLLLGNDAPNSLLGRIGDDDIRGRGGIDDVRGGAGEDVVNGGSGDDAVRGSADDDSLLGSTGTDLCVDRSGTNSFSGCETTIS